jgi:hypothetical protein
MTRLNERRSGAAFSDTPAEDVSARSAAESASGKGDAGISNPDCTDYQPETPASAHDQAMTAVPGPLSPESAVIARKIPRIEPMLRMIEECGFKIVGFEGRPITEKPVRMVRTSVGSMVFYQLLKRRGYTITLSDPPEPSCGKAGRYE